MVEVRSAASTAVQRAAPASHELTRDHADGHSPSAPEVMISSPQDTQPDYDDDCAEERCQCSNKPSRT